MKSVLLRTRQECSKECGKARKKEAGNRKMKSRSEGREVPTEWDKLV